MLVEKELKVVTEKIIHHDSMWDVKVSILGDGELLGSRQQMVVGDADAVDQIASIMATRLREDLGAKILKEVEDEVFSYERTSL